MADNVPITAGTGTTIATDDVGGVHHQQVKLVNGTLGSTTAAIVNAAGALTVALSAPTVMSTSVASSGLTIAATTYAAGDVVGAGWEFTSYAVSGSTGTITGAVLIDDGDVMLAIDVYLFDRAVTFGTDNGFPSISDADALFYVGKLAFGAEDWVGVRAGAIDSIALAYRCNGTSLFAYAMTRVGLSVFTATDDLHLRLFARLD